MPGERPARNQVGDFDAHAQHWTEAMNRGVSAADARPIDVESLRVCLVSSPVAERLEAARLLSSFGPSATEPLCTALTDRDVRVRTAAARSLAEVGDARAIRPLSRALKSCFVRRSGILNLLTGLGAATAGALLVVGTIVTLDVLALTTLFTGGSFGELMNERQRRSQLVEAISEALIRIGERDPSPELRQVLPDLRLVAVDVIQQVGRTRTASRDAATRIQQLTDRLHNLPLASAAPTIDPSELPLPLEPN